MKGRRPILSERRPIVGFKRNSAKPIVEAHVAKILDIRNESFFTKLPSRVVRELKLNNDKEIFEVM